MLEGQVITLPMHQALSDVKSILRFFMLCMKEAA